MKTFIAVVLLLFSGSARSADFTCKVPDAIIPQAKKACDYLRDALGEDPATWTNQKCVNIALRQALSILYAQLRSSESDIEAKEILDAEEAP